MPGELQLLPSEKFRNRQNLNLRKLLCLRSALKLERRFVKTRRHSFRLHRGSRFLQGDERTDGRFFTLKYTFQIPDVTSFHMPGLHLHDDLLGLPAGVIYE